MTQVSTTNNGPSAPSSSQFVAQQPLHSQAPEQQQVKVPVSILKKLFNSNISLNIYKFV